MESLSSLTMQVSARKLSHILCSSVNNLQICKRIYFVSVGGRAWLEVMGDVRESNYETNCGRWKASESNGRQQTMAHGGRRPIYGVWRRKTGGPRMANGKRAATSGECGNVHGGRWGRANMSPCDACRSAVVGRKRPRLGDNSQLVSVRSGEIERD